MLGVRYTKHKSQMLTRPCYLTKSGKFSKLVKAVINSTFIILLET